MRVLVVGSGGREHALVWALARSPSCSALLCAPGNPGIAQLAQCLPVAASDLSGLVATARRERIDLVVVGPEAPLAAGLADACRAAGLAVFGPDAAAARIESSKSFAKQLMQQAGVPTAAAHVFGSVAAARAFVQETGGTWVVKADGLAGGKGVVVPSDTAGTLAAIAALGATGAGQHLLLEARLSGPEVSLIALCDGTRLLPLALAQDHKRLLAGDAGPNTGGMGAYAPALHLGEATIDAVVASTMQPVVDLLAAQGTPFVGALYAGLMLTPDGPMVLEYNARFGDPESQVLLPLVTGDLCAALAACARGDDPRGMIGRAPGAAACVVLAADGYPEQPRRGDPISGIDALSDPHVHVFHAGTAQVDRQLVTAGGRVLGITGVDATLEGALARAYAAADQIRFVGKQLRRDIGRGARQ